MPEIDGQFNFPQMCKIIPEGKVGTAEIIHREISLETVQLEQLRSTINGHGWLDSGLLPGTYTQLYVNKELMMTDTYRERITNIDFLCDAEGDVLIAGLGIGMILFPLQEEPVNSITIVEKNPDVIALVGPHVDYLFNGQIKIINDDIFQWKTKGKFDTIYFDIWPNICGDHYEEMKTLHRKFARRLNRENPNASMNSWMRREMREEHMRDKRWR